MKFFFFPLKKNKKNKKNIYINFPAQNIVVGVNNILGVEGAIPTPSRSTKTIGALTKSCVVFHEKAFYLKFKHFLITVNMH